MRTDTEEFRSAWYAWRQQRNHEVAWFGGTAPVPTYPPDPRWIVRGTFEPHPTRRLATVDMADGRVCEVPLHGVLRFRIDGVECALEPYSTGPHPELLNVGFRDQTSGEETYAAARVVFVPRPAGGAGPVLIDFNRAINPPCAFHPYAACALPPAGNTLPVAVRAGERLPAG